ncbi:MAG TPA: CsgG/HfaB family protein [candidate division Zixibacteria bacterium]|nr:CsgG/HfaB family protein [candidate division Zixibacteria bacterium]
MYRHGKTVRVLGLLMLIFLFSGFATADRIAAQETIADQLARALGYYNDLEFDAGIKLANEVLKRPDITAQDSIATYEILSILTYAKGEDYLRESVTYLNKINSIGPCILQLPRDIWPQELRDKWFDILREANKLNCPTDSKPGMKTIAIMEFDNFSIGKYKDELVSLGKALADFFEHDFRKISDLRVVERDKIDFILKELELQRSGEVDPATAVRIGKILGAQYMVFGSITQMDAKNTRMVVRAVDVETSEVIASVDKEGKPDYSKMEKELVEELAAKFEVPVDDEAKAMLQEGGTESYDATTYYAKGLEYMDRYDYNKAYEFFKKAYETDPEFAEAKRKMEIYQPLAG